MYYYQCKRCGTYIKSSTIPSSSSCRSGSGHSWEKLGHVGDCIYQCKKCDTIIEVDSNPSWRGCPSGSGHQWNLLGRQSAEPRRSSMSETSTSGDGAGSHSTPGSPGGSIIGFIIILLWGGGAALCDHFGLWPDSKPAGTSSPIPAAIIEERRHPGAITEKPPTNPQNIEVRPAIPIPRSTPPLVPFLITHAAFVTGVPVGDVLNVRSAPAMKANSLFNLKNGQRIQITGEPVFNSQTEWVPIQSGRLQGWVRRIYLRNEPEEAPDTGLPPSPR